MLEVRDITKVYNPGTITEQCLFDHFSLKVEEGQFVAIVGSNGSGKTSLLNIICGSIPIEGGDVLVGGQSISRLKDYQRYATMGTGQLVYGLAAVIIGISFMNFYSGSPVGRGLRNVRGLKWLGSPAGTTAVILGSILYKLCIQVALNLGLPANMMKLITAVLFLLVLVVSGRKGEEIIHA